MALYNFFWGGGGPLFMSRELHVLRHFMILAVPLFHIKGTKKVQFFGMD